MPVELSPPSVEPVAVCTAASAPVSKTLAKLQSYCLPQGEESAHSIHAVAIAERGQIRMSPDARWIPFLSEQTISATRSSFHWQARLDPAKLDSLTIVDAFEDGKGLLSVRSISDGMRKTEEGGELDIAELQRYFASLILCPPALLNHQSLEWMGINSHALRVHDRDLNHRTFVDFDIAEDGRPLTCRANRPRLAGHEAIPTPWIGTYNDFTTFGDLRIPARLEVSWILPRGPFCYYQSEITSVDLL